jgi:hypothetical protein
VTIRPPAKTCQLCRGTEGVTPHDAAFQQLDRSCRSGVDAIEASITHFESHTRDRPRVDRCSIERIEVQTELPATPFTMCDAVQAALSRAWRQAAPARGMLQVGGTLHCIAHGGGRRCQQQGCSKAVARAPGSTLCTLCLRGRHTAAARRCGDAVTLSTRPVTQLARTRGDPAAGGGLRINHQFG